MIVRTYKCVRSLSGNETADKGFVFQLTYVNPFCVRFDTRTQESFTHTSDAKPLKKLSSLRRVKCNGIASHYMLSLHKPGDVLFMIDPRPYQDALDQANAQPNPRPPEHRHSETTGKVARFNEC